MSGSDLTPLPLHDLHARLGARFAAFANYDMPIQYADGVLKEHLHTRGAAGLFDVSHMGQIEVRPRSGAIEDAATALERMIPIDVLGLRAGRQRYGLLTNEAGGVLDDLMVAHRGDHYLLVVNASRKAADAAHLSAGLGADCVVDARDDRALLALQGPRAEAALAALAPNVRDMRFMDVQSASIAGADCVATRSGYTGEDGFEISTPVDAVEALAEALLAQDGVAPVGLGARDSLRLEAGLCLYGSDMDETTTPIEAGLAWAISKARRPGGAREGGFPGAAIVLAQMREGASRQRIGLRPEGRAPVRGGATLYATEDAEAPIGRVTSGVFGPSVGAPIAMGYVPTAVAAEGRRVFAELRGRRVPMAPAATPFVTQNYKR